MAIEVPIGGTIRNNITWNAIVKGESSHTFRLISIYGIGTTLQEIADNSIGVWYETDVDATDTADIPRTDPHDTFIQSYCFVGGPYSCATIIAEPFGMEGLTDEAIYDIEIKHDVLIIIPAFDATIVTTSFSII